jgi:PAS domain-containing protein
MDEAPYNSRLIKNYVEYVKKFHPKVNIDSILGYAGITTYQVEDQGHWFTQNQIDRFHEILIQKTRDPDISREVGRFAGSSQASSAVRQYALGFITPAAAYKVLEKFLPNLSRAFTLKTRHLTGGNIEVTVTPKPGVNEKPYQCENRMGLLESIAKLFTNKFAEIEHPSCLHRGDAVGRYIISWEKTPFLIWNRLRNYSFLAGIGICLGLYFVLPIVSWCISIMLCGFLSMILYLHSGHLEKKHLTKTIETQGDAAKDLLNEMNIRYNNALLVQEIGQATSTILDIDKLVRTVVSLMEKRLDFDRGMIMLHNDEKTRLVYSIGYGYSEEVEGLLRNTDFHLDNPHSRGMVVRAYKEQRSFLVNDIADIEKDVSAKSLELVKQIGGESFVCVPIVYERGSLGVLLVDNLRSERSLSQSDVNLLMGVASQTAVNIIEAMSVQKLQESEKKYRDLVENANSIILRMDTKGNIIFFNEFAQRFFGYTENEILGENLQGTILPGTESKKRGFDELITSLQKDPEPPVATLPPRMNMCSETVKKPGLHGLTSLSLTMRGILRRSSASVMISPNSDVRNMKKRAWKHSSEEHRKWKLSVPWQEELRMILIISSRPYLAIFKSC